LEREIDCEPALGRHGEVREHEDQAHGCRDQRQGPVDASTAASKVAIGMVPPMRKASLKVGRGAAI
jgi:hypothetical protein